MEETDDLRDRIREQLADLIAIRRDLHAHPELAYQEKRTSEVVQRELARAGIEFKAGLAGGTGVMAHLAGGDGSNKEYTIGLRADMDALPLQEENAVEYRSQNDGVMHACGHDGHTTILLGAARVLASITQSRGGLPRPVTLLFQPAEEGGAGAEKMVADGCLDGSVLGPPIARMFALHGWPREPLGVVGTRPGSMMAAADTFDLVIRGAACHAAWPHVGRDCVVAAAAVVTALQTISSRNVPPLESIVVSVTRVQAGTAYNILPSEARLAGTVRTLKPQIRRLAEKRLGEIAKGVAEAHGCRAELDFQRGYPPTVNHPEAVEIFRAVATQALGPDRVIEVEQPVMGGEDFAFYGQVVPSCFFILGLVPEGGPAMAELHQPTFDFNDDAIATGVEMFCRLAMGDG